MASEPIPGHLIFLVCLRKHSSTANGLVAPHSNFRLWRVLELLDKKPIGSFQQAICQRSNKQMASEFEVISEHLKTPRYTKLLHVYSTCHLSLAATISAR